MNHSIQSFKNGLVLPKPGTVVSIPIGFGFRHYGIVSDRWENGMPMVISGSNRMGKVVEESYSVFVSGRQWRPEPLIGPISGLNAILRAREKIGSKYDVFSWNCDHLVHYAVGLLPKSPQLLTGLLSAGLLLLCVAHKG